MGTYIWYLVVGVLLLLMVVLQSTVRKLPVSPAILYLLIGISLGPEIVGLIDLDPLRDTSLLKTGSELCVLISLFSVGLKIRLPLRHPGWRVAVLLATAGMLITILLLTALGVALGLSLGAAVLLGAILAPTDPVLASDVQLRQAGDQDRVRFGLTAEAGLNDGTAFPFVVLGIGLLELDALGGLAHWFAVDLVWATAAGLASGWVLGNLAGRVILFMRREHRSAEGLDEFIALGLIALAYGIAQSLHAYGFLAVFAAGLALRAVEARESPDANPTTVPVTDDPKRVATDRRTAPSHLMRSLLTFNEQLEHIAEVAVVLVIGALLRPAQFTATSVCVAAVLLLVIRPLSAYCALIRQEVPRSQVRLLAWFGIRGVGSLYYLLYALENEMPRALAERLIALVLPAVAISILVHGVSATPLMAHYQRKRSRARAR
ncbi:MAG: sodium:proton antiporter [Betaproteobacteria bacterium]